MSKNLLNKLVAVLLVILLTGTNLITLSTAVYADNSETGVNFDVYFEDGSHEKEAKISDGVKLTFKIGVTSGYLKDGRINMSNTNFKLNVNEDTRNDYIEKVDLENNIIYLNQLNKGASYTLVIPMKINSSEKFNLNDFEKQNTITLTGGIVNDETTSVQESVNLKLSWTNDAVANLEQSLFRVVRTDAKTLIQLKVKTKIEDNTLPVEQTKLELNAPVLASGKLPENVTVFALSTEGTNGDNGLAFAGNNYDYRNGKLTITVNNSTEDNIVNWVQNADDEYYVTFIYDGEVTDTSFEQTTKTSITPYGADTVTKQLVDTIVIPASDSRGIQKGTVTNLVETNLDKMPKAYLYTNNETKYNSIWEAGIDYKEIVDKIVIEQEDEIITKNDGTEIDVTDKTRFLTTKISKDNFERILGTNGEVKILRQDGTEIAKITSNTSLDTEGNYVVNYTENLSYIKIETSAPIANGKLMLINEKQINADAGFDEEEIKTFNIFKTSTTAISTIGTTSHTATFVRGVFFKEPYTDIDSYISKKELSTVVNNTNIKLNVVLKTNSEDYNLYKNPIIEIEVPEYVDDLTINSVELAIKDKLSVKSYNYENHIITVELAGEETEYNLNSLTGGEVVQLDLNMKLNELTPSKEDILKVYVTNEKATAYKDQALGKAYKEVGIRYVAPVGMVTVNSITVGDKQAISISGEQANMQIEALKEATNATINMTVINNTNESGENVKILGRVPTQNQALGNTISANMISAITAKSGISQDKITVYYTANENPDLDIAKAENGWTTNQTAISTAKTFLIVLNNYTFETGSTLEFSYDVQIPENVKRSAVSYATYAVYYSVEGTNQIAEATKVGIYTEQAADLEVAIHSDVEGQEVQEGQIITYTVSVKNKGTLDANSILVQGVIPEKTIYVEQISEGNYREYLDRKTYSDGITNLKAGETKNIVYRVKVDKLEEDEADGINIIFASAKVTVNNSNDEFKTNTLQNNVVAGNINLEITSNNSQGIDIKEGQEITYTAKLINNSSVTKYDINVSIKLPNGTTYVSGAREYSLLNKDIAEYNQNNNTITWHIDSLNAETELSLPIKVTADKLANGVFEKELKLEAVAVDENNFRVSRDLTLNITKANIEIKQTTNIDSKEIVPNDELIINVVVKNTGKRQVSGLEIIDELPSGLTVTELTSIDGVAVTNTENRVIATPDLAPGEQKEFTIRTKVDSNATGTITNSLQTKVNGEIIKSNEISYIVNPNGTSNGGNNGNSGDTSGETTYTISGIVWTDADKDGKRVDTENKVSYVRVILISKQTNNMIAETRTDSNGRYTFTGLGNGEYNVIFIYNNEVYGVTINKKAGIAESVNSDGIEVNVELDGKTVVGAMTDAVVINNSNIYNIDLGLIEKQKFDLKLSKEISNITVQSKEGTKSYDFKDGTTLAKVDIAPKYVDGATVVISYKIKVTNSGDIAGYAKNIVDYLSADVKFSSELNSSWYQGKDGNIYTTALANTIINPGETKEVTLVVTKQMTEENLGLVNNTAEIYESYNDQAVLDTNSTPANKAQSEDDYGVANIYLSLNTGSPATYIGITIAMIAVLAAGAYIINKRVLRKI